MVTTETISNCDISICNDSNNTLPIEFIALFTMSNNIGNTWLLLMVGMVKCFVILSSRICSLLLVLEFRESQFYQKNRVQNKYLIIHHLILYDLWSESMVILINI